MQKAPHIARLIFALIFLLGAIVNALMLVTAPVLYADFAIDAILPLYRQLRNACYPHLALLSAW